MDNTKPIYAPVTLYRIELYGSVDVEWLQGFDSSVEIIVGESENKENATVLHIHIDQSGIVGLVRRLYRLGITIRQV